MQAETLRTLMEIDRELITVCEAGQNGILTAAEVETRFETLRAERLRREFFLLEIGETGARTEDL